MNASKLEATVAGKIGWLSWIERGGVGEKNNQRVFRGAVSSLTTRTIRYWFNAIMGRQYECGQVRRRACNWKNQLVQGKKERGGTRNNLQVTHLLGSFSYTVRYTRLHYIVNKHRF